MAATAELTALRTAAVIGNPNCGKTTLFNALTGLRQRVGNYPGVTVEKKEGRLFFHDGSPITLLDLPGTYSLSAGSPTSRWPSTFYSAAWTRPRRPISSSASSMPPISNVTSTWSPRSSTGASLSSSH